MKLKAAVSKFLTNKWTLMVVSLLALLNVIGYMVIGNLNNVIFFIVLAVLIRYFSKNMTIVLGVPLILVNLFSMKNSSFSEGLEMKDDDKIKKEKKEKKEKKDMPKKDEKDESALDDITSANDKKDHFEVGRPKNGGSKIDYAATIENAYDDLNKVLGSEGMKSLTDDTQRLMKQQMELAESMKGMGSVVEKLMPMAESLKGMMKSMDSTGVNDMIKKAQSTLGGGATAEKPKTA
jgi:hypothetical protein